MRRRSGIQQKGKLGPFSPLICACPSHSRESRKKRDHGESQAILRHEAKLLVTEKSQRFATHQISEEFFQNPRPPIIKNPSIGGFPTGASTNLYPDASELREFSKRSRKFAVWRDC
jgi:hypothetical protein